MTLFQFFGQRTHSYSSTDNFLSPIPVSDWLMFCCGTLQNIKKEIKMLHNFHGEKQPINAKKVCKNIK